MTYSIENFLPMIMLVSIVGFLILIMYIAQKANEKKMAKLEETAQKLGLSFVKQGQHWYSSWLIRGKYNGVEVDVTPVVRGSGKNRQTFTRIRAFFTQNLNAGLQIYKENIFSKIGAAFGAQDLKIGVEEFDKKFTIKGKDETVIMPLLQNPAVQQTITDLFTELKGVAIDDTGINYEVYGTLTDENTYRSVLNKITGTIKIFKK